MGRDDTLPVDPCLPNGTTARKDLPPAEGVQRRALPPQAQAAPSQGNLHVLDAMRGDRIHLCRSSPEAWNVATTIAS